MLMIIANCLEANQTIPSDAPHIVTKSRIRAFFHTYTVLLKTNHVDSFKHCINKVVLCK